LKQEIAQFDVFLSHNRADAPAVAALAQRLLAIGLRPWLAAWNLILDGNLT
jgi:hypothetical protein